MKKLQVITAIALIAGLTISSTPASGQREPDSDRTSKLISTLVITGKYVVGGFRHDGRDRTYRLYVPAAYDPAALDEWPLVIGFHGQTQTNTDNSYPEIDAMWALADTAHFLVVYPQGLKTPQPQFYDTPGWNVHGGFGNWDDVEFVSVLIDHIRADYRVDPRRVHATGFSHGSAMSLALACRLADRIASVGSVSGPLPDVYFDDCPAERPISTLLFHGTKDPTHSINGYRPGNYMTRPVPETQEFWANHNNCSSEPTVTLLPDVNASDRTTVTLMEYPDCDAGTQVQFYRIEGGAHTWPGRASQSRWGPVNMDIDATSLIWDFFTRHPHPSPADDYYYLGSQEQVDAFPDSITEVPHHLWIGNSANIVDLNPLSAITSVAGDLQISDNAVLTSLDGLTSLASVGGDLKISENDQLTAVDGLWELRMIGGDLIIGNNDELRHLNALWNLKTVDGGVSIARNDALRNLSGLNKLTDLGQDLDIRQNATLMDVDELSGLNSIGGELRIYDNKTLESCSCGLHKCVSNGGVGDRIGMTGNALSGDCNDNGTDLVADACPSVHVPPDWTLLESGTEGTLRDVFVADANIATAVGDEGTILRTTDGGVTWVRQESGTDDVLWGVSFADPDTGTAVGRDGTILRTADGGATWAKQTSRVFTDLMAVFFTEGSTGTIVGGSYAGGGSSIILRTTDGGANWLRQSSGVDAPMSAVHFTDRQTGTVVGGEGVILRTTDGGDTWVPQESGTEKHLEAVHFTDAKTGTVVGTGGIILRTTDGGDTWFEQAQNGLSLVDVYFVDANRGVAVGGYFNAWGNPWDGVFLETTDGGETWSEQSALDAENGLYAVDFSDPNTGMIVGSDGHILARGTSAPATAIEDERLTDLEIPRAFSLRQNYPNPFNPATTISYDLKEPADILLTVINVLGQTVRVLGTGYQVPGTHSVTLEAADLPSGIYFYSLQAGNFTETKSLILAK